VNGDGFDDVIVGALLVNSLYSGAAHVIYGGLSMISLTVDQITDMQGFTLSGPSYSWFGYSVSGAGICSLILCGLICLSCCVLCR
jgi:hypothetical protein